MFFWDLIIDRNDFMVLISILQCSSTDFLFIVTDVLQ